MVPGPRKVPDTSKQSRSLTTVQVPVEAQQAPGADGHCVAEQTVSNPEKESPGLTQAVDRTSVQVPLA